ncbi:MAG: PKD domain-containing protein [Flavobacteriales bacterium]
MNQKKKGMDKMALLILSAVVIIAGVVLLLRYLMQDDCPSDISIKTEGALIAGEEIRIYVTDGNEFLWDFGDGTDFGTERSMVHTYQTEGPKLIVLTVNGKCTQELTVNIQPPVIDNSPSDLNLLKPTIEGPAKGTKIYTNKPVPFKGVCAGANSWEWTSSENVMNIVTDQNPTFTFKTPGTKSITLIVNGQSDPATFQLEVMRDPGVQPPPPPPDLNKVVMKYLKEIAAGDNSNYQRLNELCKSPSIPIVLADGKSMPLSTYITRLPMLTKVDGSTLHVEQEGNYITKINIKK